MRASTVDYSQIPEPVDVAKKVRGVMAEEKITASDMSRVFGGAVTYWTNRLVGRYTFTPGDLQAVALMCGRHPAELLGGVPPSGWQAPPRPDIPGAGALSITHDYRARHLSVVPDWVEYVATETG